MGEYANFYKSVNGDREYDDESFSEWLSPFFNTGVFQGNLQVLEKEKMTVKVSTGYCHINGKTRTFDSETNLTLDVANPIYGRIDSIVIRRNDTERNITLEVLKGTESSNPVAQEPVRENGIYDLVIAQIYVGASITKITQANITDTRMIKSLCGYVASTVKEIDFTQISKQFDKYFEEFKETVLSDFKNWDTDQQTQFALWANERKIAFNNWFEKVQETLSGNVAGNLQKQITDNESEIDDLYEMITTNEFAYPILDDDGEAIIDDEENLVLATHRYHEL